MTRSIQIMQKLAKSIYVRHLGSIKLARPNPPNTQDTSGIAHAVGSVMAGRLPSYNTYNYNTNQVTNQAPTTTSTTNTTQSPQPQGVSAKPSKALNLVRDAASGKIDSTEYVTSPSGFKNIIPSVTYEPKNSWLNKITVSPMDNLNINLDEQSRDPNNPNNDMLRMQNPYRSDSIPVDYGLQIKGKFK